jgi:hypothetical protein
VILAATVILIVLIFLLGRLVAPIALAWSTQLNRSILTQATVLVGLTNLLGFYLYSRVHGGFRLLVELTRIASVCLLLALPWWKTR